MGTIGTGVRRRTAPTPLVRLTRDLGRQVVGGFFLTMGGVHLGLVAAGGETYRHFADGSFLGFVREGWEQVFMANTTVWGLLLMLAEVTMGTLLLVGGRAARYGWGGVIGFHVLLMLFGFGIWAWCLPALALLVWLSRPPRSSTNVGPTPAT